MNRNSLLAVFLILLGCSSGSDIKKSESETTDAEYQKPKSKYLRWVGDSEFNAELDDEQFQPCFGDNQVKQYFNFSDGLSYEGEKTALVKEFEERYQPVTTEQSGWIRVRFIVNCKGDTGRFRVMGADKNYNEFEFDETITNQLLEITKSLDKWIVLPQDKPGDYYQYLMFKINNGNLIEIMP